MRRLCSIDIRVFLDLVLDVFLAPYYFLVEQTTKRLGRKTGRSAASKRSRSKRRERRARIVEEFGVEELKKIILKERRDKEEQLGRLKAAMDDPCSLQLVVDLSWAEGDASGKELSSLAKQLCYVYNRVKASITPPVLTLTSYRGRTAAVLDNVGAGSWLAHRWPLDVFAVFDNTSVVYLSPDAEEPLEEVVATDVYVIGGIVDRNLDKGITKAAAEAGKARTARLPFDDYLPEVSGRDRVLTVCACVGVLIAVHAGENWRAALEQSVPHRRVAHGIRRPRGGAWRGAAPSNGSGWGPGKALLGSNDTCHVVTESASTIGDRGSVVLESRKDSSNEDRGKDVSTSARDR